MLFSSTIFLIGFLPGVTVIYYLLKPSRQAQNVFLCAASLFFYAWGEPKFVLVMMASIVVNWYLGLAVDRFRDDRRTAKLLIFLDVFANLSIIFVFKYLMFTVRNINSLFSADLTVPEIALPIGISFFTFQALSYVIDVYRQKGEAQKNILNVGLYISFFPQLIAGPIVRYETIAHQVRHRRETWDDFSAGVVRFILGLGKKVLIANNMAVVADRVFGIAGGAKWFGAETSLSAGLAWIGVLAYTFQIYFDFSGYSDMAIGLGKMFGFHFVENFDYPYISKSITEFWRRWHISLSTWFRDYVYIPLGGNRVKTKARMYFNLFVVWLLTGIWHGANWTFIAWGLYYFCLLVIEKSSGMDKEGESAAVAIVKHAVTLFLVMIGWVLFRADTIGSAFAYIGCMFGAGGAAWNDPASFFLGQYWVFFLLAALFSVPVVPKFRSVRENASGAKRIALDAVSLVFLAAVFLISVSYIVTGGYNPFIYFNF